MSTSACRAIVAFSLTVGALALSSRPAAAQRAAFPGPVCVTIDTTRDSLSEGDRKSALSFIAGAFQQSGVTVVETGCPTTFTLYHLRFGNSVTVYLMGPPGMRQATARALEEVPYLYSQMVHSLVSGQPMSTANDTVDRTNVTSAQMAPNRAEADSLWYARLGYGTTLGGSASGGPAFGFGYRYELDSLGIDMSFLNFNWAATDSDSNGSNGEAKFSGSFIKLMGLWFADPIANRSLYVGGGLSWGASAVVKDGFAYSDSGLNAEASVGYELLRASTIRIFTQFDATLPLYQADRTHFGVVTTGSKDSIYTPSFVVSLGIGWGRGNHVLNVRTLP